MDKSTIKQPPKVHPKKYPLVGDFIGVINTKIVNARKGERAIDVLNAPFEQLTNLYDRLLNYLYKNHTQEFTRSELTGLASIKGYDSGHTKLALRKLETDLRLSSWWDSEQREVIYRWLYQTEEDYEKRVAEDEWFENLPE